MSKYLPQSLARYLVFRFSSCKSKIFLEAVILYNDNDTCLVFETLVTSEIWASVFILLLSFKPWSNDFASFHPFFNLHKASSNFRWHISIKYQPNYIIIVVQAGSKEIRLSFSWAEFKLQASKINKTVNESSTMRILFLAVLGLLIAIIFWKSFPWFRRLWKF